MIEEKDFRRIVSNTAAELTAKGNMYMESDEGFKAMMFTAAASAMHELGRQMDAYLAEKTRRSA